MKYANEELLGELQKATKERDKEVTYDFFNDREGPSSRTLEMRFGTFTKAKRLAGVSKKGYAGKLPVDSNYFSEIDSSESAYWLGVLYGDGWVEKENGNDKICLAMIDKEHIKKFKGEIDAAQSITKHTKGEHQPLWRLTIADQTLVDDLSELGCGEDKTFSNSLPEIQPKQKADFVRGLFDADGHYQNRGTTFFLTGANGNRLEKLVGWIPCSADVSEGDKKYHLRVSQHHGVAKLWNWLYPDGIDTEPSLRRKKEEIHG